MSDAIGIILIICFLVMTYAFAQLAVGRKKGDQQIIDDLLERNNLLSEKHGKLLNKHNELVKSIAREIKNGHDKLGGLGHKTTFVKFNEAKD